MCVDLPSSQPVGGLMKKQPELLPLTIQLFAEGDPLNLNIDDLFNDPDTPPVSDPVGQEGMTERMTKRINDVKAKTAAETREAMAKELGYENYETMLKSRERSSLENAGYNPEELEAVINPIIEQRIANDPRMARIADFEAREREQYITNQLKEINQATGQQLTLDQLPQETINLWGNGLDLKQAYFATHGEALVNKNMSNHMKGGTTHLASHGSGSTPNSRGLTASEKETYRAIVVGITEEELDKIIIATEK